MYNNKQRRRRRRITVQTKQMRDGLSTWKTPLRGHKVLINSSETPSDKREGGGAAKRASNQGGRGEGPGKANREGGGHEGGGTYAKTEHLDA